MNMDTPTPSPSIPKPPERMWKDCIECGGRFYRPGNVRPSRWVVRQVCSQRCAQERSKARVADRFWSYAKPNPLTGCIEWTGALNEHGYGRAFFRGKPGILAHRVAWTLAHGQIRDGMHVLHRCDVRACVNVAHLYEGTQQDNVNDMIERGRWAGPDSISPYSRARAALRRAT